MSEKSTKISLSEIPKEITIYLCGDDKGKSCGLSGKLVALGCSQCFYKAGQIGRNYIKQGAEIIYNKNLNLW